MDQRVGQSIPHALINVAFGVAAGPLIDLLVPPDSSSDEVAQLGFHLALQAALNGVAIAALVPMMSAERDPTFGIPFYAALMNSQPSFARRLARAGVVTKYHTSQVAQQMGLPAIGGDRPSEDPQLS